VQAHGAHFIHGRALPFASGISLSRPDLHVFVFGGDGDAFSIGGNHFTHTARKNIKLTYVVMDNWVYGLTKNRPAPTQLDRRRLRGQPAKALAGYEKARALGAEFVLAPELFLCGYPPRDLLLRADFVEANLAALAETAKASAPFRCASVALTKIPNVPDARSAIPPPFCKTAKSSGARTKSLLPTYDVFDEDRYFEPAKRIAPSSSTAANSASRFARTSGTTRISGRNGFIAATRSRNSSRRARKSSSTFPRRRGTTARNARGWKCSSAWRATSACRWRRSISSARTTN
jgi:hypothetical protein